MYTPGGIINHPYMEQFRWSKYILNHADFITINIIDDE